MRELSDAARRELKELGLIAITKEAYEAACHEFSAITRAGSDYNSGCVDALNFDIEHPTSTSVWYLRGFKSTRTIALLRLGRDNPPRVDRR